MRRTRHIRGGYTLVELIVAVGLFAFVMTLAAGAYLMMISANRHAEALASGIDNLSFALDEMTRDIRTGSDYCNGGSCAPDTFTFLNSTGAAQVTYALSTLASECEGNTLGCVTRQVGSNAAVPLTEPSVEVDSLTFTTFGTAPGSGIQSRVVIVVSGKVEAGPGSYENFTVETGATMRSTNL